MAKEPANISAALYCSITPLPLADYMHRVHYSTTDVTLYSTMTGKGRERSSSESLIVQILINEIKRIDHTKKKNIGIGGGTDYQRFDGMMPLFLFILILYSKYIHSITFIQYIHPSSFAVVPLHLLIAGQLGWIKLPGVPSR